MLYPLNIWKASCSLLTTLTSSKHAKHIWRNSSRMRVIYSPYDLLGNINSYVYFLFITLFNSNFLNQISCIKEHICVPSVCTKYKTTYLRPWMKYVGIHYYHDWLRSNYSYSVSLHIWKEYALYRVFYTHL